MKCVYQPAVIAWRDETTAGVIDNLGGAPHVGRDDWHAASERFGKDDPERLRFDVRLREHIRARQQSVDIAPFTKKCHSRLETELANFIDHCRGVGALTRALCTTRNPQHPRKGVQAAERAHQLEMSFPCLHPAGRENHDGLVAGTELAADFGASLRGWLCDPDRAVDDATRCVRLEQVRRRGCPFAVADHEISTGGPAGALDERRPGCAVVLPEDDGNTAATRDAGKDRVGPRSMTDDSGAGTVAEQVAKVIPRANNR